MELIKTARYIAIRKDLTDDYEWMDMKTVEFRPEYVRRLAESADVALPEWSADNPVIRIRLVEIVEVPLEAYNEYDRGLLKDHEATRG